MRTGGAVGLDQKQIKWVRVRVGLLAIAFVPLFLVMAWKAARLQLVDGPRMRQMAQEQYVQEDTIAPRRGVIYDRNGTPLAASVDVDSISCDPSALPANAVPTLAKVLNLPVKELDKKIAKAPKHFVWLKRGATPSEVTAAKALQFTGLTFVKEPRRFYPQRELAANVLGFAGVDGEGLEGVELAYNDVLKGHAESIDIIKDAQRRSVFAEGVVDTDGLSGAKVELTIDRGIQHIAETALAHVVQKSKPTGAMAVVMDPSTGEILALASAPSFNPNDPGKSERSAMRNRPVVDAFEPGSTFKAFSVAAAIEEKVVKPTDTIFCENGRYPIGNKAIHDHEPLGSLTVTQVIQKSSNIGAAKIAEKLGREKLISYYKAFGFDEKTGLGMPGEVRGTIPFPKADIQLATESFGQGLTANAIQLTAGYAALANHGQLMRPFLVRKVVDPEGTVLESHGPEPVRQVVSAQTAQTMTAMMETVVEKGGTAELANMSDYQVAGKTGTAQKADPETGGYSADRRTASFIGFVPAEAPKLVIAVIIDEPQGDKYGGKVAAPAFKEIAEQALPQLGVPPRHRDPMPVAAAEPTPKTPPPAEAAEDDEPEEVLAAGANQSIVPNLAGLGARDAAKALVEAELEPALQGSGRTIGQVPAAGAVVPRGTKVSVRLESRL
ncbi:MAG: transpeptidase family protein [Deltaproteobacteria bacterium]|nr:transpeptidase family protein [Deltaproteobacteria bacterium]